ncbi:MAG: type II toxin-antitoxin system RelE/ParE family toxin [Mogibacterium sp.]|nr:type II toxin-antitoxin system RelE/ParE family toxin [Mogibacterium sp.]
MYTVVIYEDPKGRSDVEEFIKELREASTTSKDASVNFNKVIAYIRMLQKHGPKMQGKYAKHLEGEIWELRPLSNRILYAHYENGIYVLLHHFRKRTQKTPRREIERAKREFEDYKRREGKNEKVEGI